jgi:hypothetical protein
MGKTEASYMIYAIENDRIDISKLRLSKQQILDNLQKYPIKTLNMIQKEIGKQNFCELCPEMFSQYIKFYVYGCPRSTDIDVIIIIDKIYLIDGNPKPLFPKEYERLIQELSEFYDITRPIDYNLIAIEDGYIIGQSKGGLDTANILLKTHYLHKQKYIYDINLIMVQPDLKNKIISIAKFCLDNLEDIAIDYQSIRKVKMSLYLQGCEKMIEYSQTLVDKIHINFIELNEPQKYKWYNFMKSFTMKIIQLALIYYKHECEYIKDNLVKVSELFELNPNNSSWFLFRGREGEFSDDYIVKLFALYNKIVLLYNLNLNITTIQFNKYELTNNTELSEQLYRYFIESPNFPSSEFINEFTKTSLYQPLNNLFLIPSSNITELNLPTIIKEKFIQVDQRTDEWTYLRTEFYQSKKTINNTKDTIEGIYNLLRGSVTESIILNKFQPEMIGLSSEWQKITIGLLVEHKGIKNALCCSPDLLLIKENKIIPVEIKTLHCSIKNNDYYRGLNLAKKQCQDVKNILDSENKYNLFSQYMIILGYYTDTDLIIDCHIYDFE